MNDSTQLLRELDADRARAYRRFYAILAITCAAPIAIAGALWLIAVLT